MKMGGHFHEMSGKCQQVSDCYPKHCTVYIYVVPYTGNNYNFIIAIACVLYGAENEWKPCYLHACINNTLASSGY